ncbi:hypothetical protein S83_010757 [Arachis hypogaea]|nr:class E vacuolar protein-sorting machinery protein-like [Arachis hypogaea]
MSVTSHVADSSTTVPSNALALPDPPAPVSTGKDQDIIDLLSLTLSLTPSTPQENYTSSATSVEGMHQAANPSTTEGYSNAPQTYPGNKQYNSYVAPWARPQSLSEPQVQSQQQMYQPQSQSRSQAATPPSYESEQSLHNQPPQFQQSQPFQQQNQPPLQTPPSYESEQSLNRQTEFQQSQPFQQQTQPPLQSQHPQYSASPQYQPSHAHLQPQPQHFQAQPQPQHFQGQVRSPPQPQLQSPPQHFQAPPQQQRFQNQHIQYPGSYPPPPWASTPGYPNYQNHLSPTNSFSNPQANTTGPFTFPSNGAGSAVGANFGQRSPGSTGSGQRPFIPSYRLFEDLNVFGNTDGRVKMTDSGTSSGMSGTMGPDMVGGRK